MVNFLPKRPSNINRNQILGTEAVSKFIVISNKKPRLLLQVNIDSKVK